MNKDILLIVEGDKTEKEFFKRIEELLSDKLKSHFNIYSFKTNIYTLYNKIKKDDYYLNIQDVLIEMNEEYRKELEEKSFSDIYLIFDLDAHHTRINEIRSYDEIIKDNISIVSEMIKHFDNETDPTKGKIYINYPMMESFKDCDSLTFFDPNYKDEIIKDLAVVKNFKEYISKKKIANLHINKMTLDCVENLTIQNIFKLNSLENKRWEMIVDYRNYLDYSEPTKIIEAQKQLINKNMLSILNTSLFLIVDYFGNHNGYYSYLVNKAKEILMQIN